jgi:hypothetical protein
MGPASVRRRGRCVRAGLEIHAKSGRKVCLSAVVELEPRFKSQKLSVGLSELGRGLSKTESITMGALYVNQT